MRRRRYLVGCALVAGAPLAGCTGDTSEPTETEAAAEQTAYEDAFREELAREDVEIVALGYDDGRVTLEYEPPEPTEESVEASIEVGARAFFDRVYGGWTADRLDASVFVDGSLVATWHMDTEWIDAYLAGEITRDELGERVEGSVERYDEAASGDGDGDGGDGGDDGDGGDGEGDEGGEGDDDTDTDGDPDEDDTST